MAQIQPRHSDPLMAVVRAPAGFVATPAPIRLDRIQGELHPATIEQVEAFRRAAGSNWEFYVDRRSGGMATIKGQGIPWVAGRGNSLPAAAVTIDMLAQKAIAIVDTYPALFPVPSSELVLNRKASKNYGEENRYWNVVFNQTVNGIPVEDSHVSFFVSHGNLVMLGVNRILPRDSAARATTASITPAQARAALGTYVGGLLAGDVFLQEPKLGWVLRGTADAVGYAGPVGAGWNPQLAYELIFKREGAISSWKVLVSAVDGSVLRFVDGNDYAAALAKAGVYTITNCADPANCDLVPGSGKNPGTLAEVPVTMPFLRLNFAGGICQGDACYTNAAGAFDYPAGATAVAATLEGKYFRVTDGCGPITAAGAAGGHIDFGTSDPAPFPGNTDCVPATHASDSNTPVANGTGDTHAARNTYYHLNLIASKSRFYLPTNEWLQGNGGPTGPILVSTNVAPVCNAFWQGGTGMLAFFKVQEAQFCNNTGEIPDVFLHEFGHGLDQNDGSGTAPEQATGEAMGDTFALLQGQQPCFTPAFRLEDPSDPFWGNNTGYGHVGGGAGAMHCSGVRDLDYTAFCEMAPRILPIPPPIPSGSIPRNPGCQDPIDPDAVNGSRSGPTFTEPAGEFGTPARWNHMLVNNPDGGQDGISNFWACGGPETTGCAGPLDHGCHCESLIASQANWDLAKTIIRDIYGGDVYATAGPREVSGWQYMDRLWYLTRDGAVSAYDVIPPDAGSPEGTPATTNGCEATNWFSQYLLIDDDDGNLANGTPHAAEIFRAYDLHAIACGEASDASNQSTRAGALIAAPTLSVCGLTADTAKAPVQLTWTASAGAAKYHVLRNTLGCSFGFTPIAVIKAGREYFEDGGVAPGIPYYYSVQPIGSTDSNYGFASNCVKVIPESCPTNTLVPPTNVTATASAPNQITVSWTAAPGAMAYKILRRDAACTDETVPFIAVGVIPASQTSFVDRVGIEGGRLYSYVVVSADALCATCQSPPSACASVVATGVCLIKPVFAGVRTVITPALGECQLIVKWNPATVFCSPTVAYDVYRSTDPEFVPSPATLIGSTTGTEYLDRDVLNGVRYYYIVRARDGVGNFETNLIRRFERPAGPLTAGGSLFDDAGDTQPMTFTKSGEQLTNRWAIRDSDTGNETRVWATTEAEGEYPDNACQSIESNTIFLGPNPELTFRTRYFIEPAWDGGIVEVATEDNGFTDWTKLDTVSYTSMQQGPAGDPACGPPFVDGELFFSGESDGWEEHSGSLAEYAGENVRIRFTFSSDSGNLDRQPPITETTNFEGWFIDDIRVTDIRTPGVCITGALPVITSILVDVNCQNGMRTLIVTGTGFQPGSVVQVNGQDRPTTFVSNTELRATLAPQDSGTVSVRVVTGSNVSASVSVLIPLFGDLNLDGSVDAQDLVIIANYLVGNAPPGTPPFTAPLSNADLNRNGSVDAVDYVILANYLVGNITCLPTQ